MKKIKKTINKFHKLTKIKKQDLISIIIPIYNSAPFLAQCLNSIISQTYKNLEIILVNDASTDDSLLICKEFQKIDNRIVIIDNPQNMGVSYSRNMGIKRSSGAYIGFVDSDDFINPVLYETLYETCLKYNLDLHDSGISVLKIINYYINQYNKKEYNI